MADEIYCWCMDKGEKPPQTTYILMGSYLTALVIKSVFETPSTALWTSWLSSDQEGKKKSRIMWEERRIKQRMPVFHSTYPCLANLGARHAVIMVQFQKGSNTIARWKKGETKEMERILRCLLLSLVPNFILLPWWSQCCKLDWSLLWSEQVVLMFHVLQQFQKVAGCSNKEEHVNLLSEKTGNKQVKFCSSFHF